MAAQSTPQGPLYSAPPMGGLPPTVAATPPGSTPPAPSYTPAPPYGSSFNNDMPAMPNTGYGNDMVPPPPAPTPTDPYAMGGLGSPQFQPPKKKTSPWLIIGIVVVALVVVVVGSSILLTRGNGNRNGNGPNNGPLGIGGGSNYAPSANLSNLAVTYAGDDITFKSVQQAQKFPDDELAKDNILHKYYVRVNIHETNQAADFSDVLYDQAFHLTLPDGTSINPLNEQTFEGPKQGENRDNWIDFPTSGQVDLSKLTLVIGQANEQQMKVPLQSGANLSQYLPKKITPNQHFQYANIDWVLQDATEELSFGGQQAKKGQAYVIVDLIANNNSQAELFLTGNFANLHSGSTSTAPDILGSNTDNFDDIQPGSTNVTGTFEFPTPVSPDGQYTLALAASTGGDIPWPATSVPFTIN